MHSKTEEITQRGSGNKRRVERCGCDFRMLVGDAVALALEHFQGSSSVKGISGSGGLGNTSEGYVCSLCLFHRADDRTVNAF